MTEVAFAYGPGEDNPPVQSSTGRPPSTSRYYPPSTTRSTTTGSSSSSKSSSSASASGEDDPEDTSSGGGGGGGGGGSVTNITNITNNYYFDVGLQFKPKVGIVTPINTFEDIIFGGSLDKYVYDGSDKGTAQEGMYLPKGTVWTPELSELPDFTSALGRYFKYGVLYNGYWDSSLDSPSDKAALSIYRVAPRNNTTDGIHDGETPGAGAAADYDGKFVYSVEPSWDQRDPGLVITDDHKYVNFYTPDEMALYNIAPFDYNKLPEFVKTQSKAYVMPWASITNGYILARPNPSSKGGPYLYDAESLKLNPADYNLPAVSNYIGTMWYKNTDVSKTTQTSTGPSGAIYIPDAYKTDEFLRALEILGPDILYRDEWVCRVVVNEYRNNTQSPAQQGSSSATSTGEYAGLYNYVYNAISVLDDDLLAGKDLLTKDYVIQSLYRAVGVNCLKTSTFLYKDVNANVDFTPLAEKITVNMDRINQIQNHMQVFVTKASLDDYWQRALDDGIVTGSDHKTYNTLDAVYKPFYSIAANDRVPNPNDDNKEWVYGEEAQVAYKGKTDSHITSKVCVETEWNSSALKKYDAERFTHITLADFCVLAKRVMDIYGEEKLTDKEIELLLVTYGSKLPYNLEAEKLEAIKYLMAKGIVTDQMYWSGELKVEDMIVILSRIADKGSRLTFKEVTITYDPNLVSAGYYPTSLDISNAENSPVQVESVSFTSGKSYVDSKWTDFFVRLGDVTYKNLEGKEVTINPRFSKVTETGEPTKYTENIFLVAETADGGLDIHNKDSRSTPDQFRVVEILNGHDGYEYMHFQVASSILYDTTSDLHKKFVYDGHIYVNTSEETDTPGYWKVSATGGIFTSPTVRTYDVKKDGKVVGKMPYIMYSDGGYSAKIKSNIVNHTTVTVSPDERVLPNDYAKLYELHISTTNPITTNEDGYVISGTHNGIKEYPKVKGYISFDAAGMSIEYCDYQRYLTGAATLFSKNSYLANDTDTTGKSIESMAASTYELIFSVSLDEINEGDICWGDESTVIISQGKANVVNSPEGVTITYLYSTPTRAFYKIADAHSIADVSSYIHTKKNGKIADANVDYTVGYMKAYDTLLIPSETLRMLMQDGYGGGTESVRIVQYSDSILMITYTPTSSDESSAYFTSPFTVVLNNELHMVAVNSVIYKVPSNEILWTQNTLMSGGEYLINYRAAQGYNSGYKISKVGTDGSVSISVDTSDDTYHMYTMVTDMWTRCEYGMYYRTSFTNVEENGDDHTRRSILLNGPNNLANFVVYVSETAGTYLFVLKNNDKYASNGYLASETNQAAVQSSYALGAQYLDLFFGLDVGADGTANSDILVAGQILSEDTGTLVVKDVRRACKADEGKILYDTQSGGYFYVLPMLNPKDAGLGDFAYHKLQSLEKKDSRGDYNTLLNISTYLSKKYYSNEWLLPYAMLITGAQEQLTAITFASNVQKGLPFGVTPVFATSTQSEFGRVSRLEYGKNPSTFMSYSEYAQNCYNVDENEANSTILFNGYACDELKDARFNIQEVNLAPTGLPFIIMGISTNTYEELINANTATNTIVTYGNWVSRVVWKKDIEHLVIFPNKNNNAMCEIPIDKERLRLINGSLAVQWISVHSFGWKFSDQRDTVIENATKPDLDDADQPLYVDWGKYTFNTLIHDIDNGLSIVLIIVLNFLPRLGMFIFLILITLGTISNVGWWKKFCTNIFDPYKFLTFGHSDVNTIDSRRLLLTSIIGLAVFALFMDGTLINLLTWLCQWVMELIARK